MAGAAVASTIVLGTTMFNNANGFLLFLIVACHSAASIAYAYLVSVFFSRARVASSVGMVGYLALAFPYYGVGGVTVSPGAKAGASVCAPTAFSLAVSLLSRYAQFGQDVTFGNATATVNNTSLAACLAWMAGDALAYGLVAWYLERVLPWRTYGVALPWYFCCTRRYWAPSTASPTAGTTAAPPGAFAAPAPPLNADCEGGDAALAALVADQRCVALRHLRKLFPTPAGIKVAVEDLSMDVVEGQVCVLLGRNGAGKSTSIALLTGMLPASGGEVRAFGTDLMRHRAAVPGGVGICPQANCIFPTLTVAEHMRLLAALKRLPPPTWSAAIEAELAGLGLSDKVRLAWWIGGAAP